MAMASFGRKEVGALGYIHQGGPQRGNFKGINGRAQQGDSSRNPNHAPQRVSPKPWMNVMPPAAPQQPPRGGEEAAATAAATAPASLGNLGNFLTVLQAAQRAAPKAVFPAGQPSTAGTGASGGPAVSSQTDAVDGAEGPATQELREDLLAHKSRLDSVSLRLAQQENVVKAVEVSLSSLREEYGKISQQTDGQSSGRLDACERGLARLEDAFRDFSSSLQREIKATEETLCSNVGGSAPISCTTLEPTEDLDVLESVLLYLPLHLNDSKDVCLYRKTLDVASGALVTSDFVVQRASGDPCVMVH